MRSLSVLLLLLAPALYAADFEVRPAPAWVERGSIGAAAQLPSRAGVAGILTDHQVRVEGADVDEYFRRVRKVVSAAGVQNASELSIDFDPSYQRLVLHDVALLRGAARIEQLKPSEVRVIEKEPESEDRIYDGQLTALIFLKDVRPDDVIDYAYSLEGANPLLGGRYADEYDFAASVPTALVRHRLVWPAGRGLRVRGAARVEHRGARDIYVWEQRDVEAVDDEDSVPEYYDSYYSVQVSEYASWSEVARWSEPMFVPDLESSAAAASLAQKIRAEHPSREQQIAAAIRFVQDDIRYLGIEMGAARTSRGSRASRSSSATATARTRSFSSASFSATSAWRRIRRWSTPSCATASTPSSPLLFSSTTSSRRSSTADERTGSTPPSPTRAARSPPSTRRTTSARWWFAATPPR